MNTGTVVTRTAPRQMLDFWKYDPDEAVTPWVADALDIGQIQMNKLANGRTFLTINYGGTVLSAFKGHYILRDETKKPFHDIFSLTPEEFERVFG